MTTGVESLQQTLAAEHAAIYVLAALGGRASSLPPPSPLRAALDAAYDAHVARRDELRSMISAAGDDPVAAETAYRLPRPLTSRTQIAAEALRVERACVTTYAALVAATVDAERRWAIDALVTTAVGELSFGGGPEPLPGVAGP